MPTRYSKLPCPHAEPLESRRLLAAGDPDPTFSGDGVTMLDQLPGGPITAYDVALQTDGKAVVAGYQEGLYSAARLNVDGSIDTAFGNGGVYAFATGVIGLGGSPQVAIQPDGKIIIGGPKFSGTSPVIAVARLTASGQPDTAFGANGVVYTNVGDDEHVNDVTVQQDGKIVVAGYARIGGDYDFVVARYFTSGVNEFVRTIGFGSDDGAHAVAIDYNGTPATNPLYGSIVAAGTRGDDFAVARLTPAGQLDNSFDGDGKVSTSFPGREVQCGGVIVQPNGKIVATGESSAELGHFDVAMVRYLSDGDLDPTFGAAGNGRVEQDFGGDERRGAAAVGMIGTILLAGTANNGGRVFAFTPDGLVETRFAGGVVTSDVDYLLGIATTGFTGSPVRRFVVVGDQHVARYIDLGTVASLGAGVQVTTEAHQETLNVIVARTDLAPVPSRIYINFGGSATRPYFTNPLNWDYSVSGISGGTFGDERTYVEIPAGQTSTTFSVRPINDTRVEGDETIALSVAPDDGYEVGTPSSVTLQIWDDEVSGPPAVEQGEFLFETAPQRVTFRFNQPVGASVGPEDFQVSGPGGAVPFAFQYAAGLRTATLSFTGGILPDGDYTARVIASGISNGGQPMAADHVLNFFFLNGDANRDRRVNLQDFNILASNFGQSPRTFSQGDFSYDNTVNLTDFNILASRFGMLLAGLERGSPFGGGQIESDDEEGMVPL